MEGTLFDKVYSVNRATFQTDLPTVTERNSQALAEQVDLNDQRRMAAAKYKMELFETWRKSNLLVAQVLETDTTFLSLYESIKMDSASRVLLPARKNKEVEQHRQWLSEIIPNTEHLKRRGVFYPDNTIAGGIYGALAGVASSILLGEVNPYACIGGFAVGGIVGTLSSVVSRNRSFINFESHQDASAPRPWDALQVLDLERAYFLRGNLSHWAHMDISPVDISAGLRKVEHENLRRNQLLMNEGITHFYDGTDQLFDTHT